MTSARSRAATWVAAIAVLGVGTTLRAEDPRRTPIVEAVQKTRAGVVTIRVERPLSATRTKETFGTGILVDERGYVVTNHHVIASASALQVILADGTRLVPRVLARDAACDLAILHVLPDRGTRPLMQALPLGCGTDLLVGETVIAVGSPYGYTHTVSTGIISALGREIVMPSGEKLGDLIQTNASINPGNSGGPLLNINGEVIGMNVALREGAQGIAFALNVETVKQALSRHLSSLKVAGVYHGLVCSERVFSEGAQRQRVVVAEVGPRTPAALAGLRKGDEIVRVAGRTVANRFDLERALWDRKPGDSVTLAVVRQGALLALPVTLDRGVEGRPVTTTAEKGVPMPGPTRAAGSDLPPGMM